MQIKERESYTQRETDTQEEQIVGRERVSREMKRHKKNRL